MPTLAQVGTCNPGESSAILDAGNVEASIYNNGALFWNGGPNVYEVPRGSGVQAIFNTTLLVGGLIDEDLRMASSTYGPYEFWPGPLDANGNAPQDCSIYDQIWEIRSEDFELVETDGVFSQNMRAWPWQLGAPVVDGDGDATNYNLEGGDRPELLGDQSLWWVMNDRGNVHGFSDVAPIGLEIHGTAYGYNHPSAGDITFYRYTLINKNTAPLTDAFLGMYVDSDLGNFSDDYIGSDSLLHLGYTYNADNLDENGYEDKPPALGFTFLVTPEADIDNYDNDRDGEVDEPGESVGLYAFTNFPGGSAAQQDPNNGEQMYNYMRGLWKDGQAFTEGGDGRTFSSIPTRFVYPANPATRSYWSEMQPIPGSNPIPPADRNFTMSAGPFSLAPNAHTEFLIGVVWAQGVDHLDSVTRLKGIVRNMQVTPERFLSSGYQPGQAESPPFTPEFVLGFDQNFPNPFSDVTTLRYSLPKEMHVRLTVFDMLGRQIDTLVEGIHEAGIYTTEFNASGLPSGLYYAHIELDHLSFTRKLVKAP